MLLRPQCFCFYYYNAILRLKVAAHLHMVFGNTDYIVGFVLKCGLFAILSCHCLWLCLCIQIMTCVPAPRVNSSVRIILVELFAPVTMGIDMTGNDTKTGRNHTAWVSF